MTTIEKNKNRRIWMITNSIWHFKKKFIIEKKNENENEKIENQNWFQLEMFDVKQNKNTQKNESISRRFILFLYYYFTNKISIYITIFARNNREFLICVDCSFKFNFAISILNISSTKNTSFVNRVLYLILLSFKFFNFFANKSTIICSQNLFSRV